MRKDQAIDNFPQVFQTSLAYVLSKWISGKSAYEKDIATLSDADTGLDQLKLKHLLDLAKKSGSVMHCKSGVTKPFFVYEGKCYLFDLTDGAQLSDYQNLEVAVANKAANSLATTKLNKYAGILTKKYLQKNKLESAKVTSLNTSNAAIANLNL